MTSPTRGADPTAPLVLVADDEPDVLGSVVPSWSAPLPRDLRERRQARLDEIRRTADACVLDVLMPGADGAVADAAPRENCARRPLTQVGEAVERAMALEEGADDYLNKPFDPHELVARVRAVLRRTRNDGPRWRRPRSSPPPGLALDRVDGARGWASGSSSSPPRASLLEYLMMHADELVERSRLLEVLGYDGGHARGRLARRGAARVLGTPPTPADRDGPGPRLPVSSRPSPRGFAEVRA